MDKNNKILITGASGFVGRNLFNYLKKEGYNVVGTSYEKRQEDLMFCDLTNYDSVNGLFKSIRPDYVFMLATKTYAAGVMISNPESLVRENIIMNANTLEIAKHYQVKKLLCLSSSTVYQESTKPLAEEDLDLNISPYHTYFGVGWVKRYTEQLCKFYDSLGLPINIIRPTNIYGPNDKYNEKSHFLPAIIKRILEKQNPLIIWGTGNSIKNMIYIDDFIRDIIIVANNCNKFEIFNLCSNNCYNIREIVDIVLELCNYKVETIYDITKPDAIPYRNLIRNKFDSHFGKQQYTDLREGIKVTIEWLKRELKYEQ